MSWCWIGRSEFCQSETSLCGDVWRRHCGGRNKKKRVFFLRGRRVEPGAVIASSRGELNVAAVEPSPRGGFARMGTFETMERSVRCAEET